MEEEEEEGVRWLRLWTYETVSRDHSMFVFLRPGLFSLVSLCSPDQNLSFPLITTSLTINTASILPQRPSATPTRYQIYP
jgi:hypothetical protein